MALFLPLMAQLPVDPIVPPGRPRDRGPGGGIELMPGRLRAIVIGIE